MKKDFSNCNNPILESISDGVFTVDENWKITSFNRAAEKITNISRKEAIGQLCSEVFKSSMCETSCALRKTLESGEPIINQSCFIIDSEGNKIPISVSTAVLRDKDGVIIGGAETFRDLSEIEALRNEIENHYSIGNFISHSKAMSNILELAKAVAESPSTILIQGETGTGKEVLARAIHDLGKNKEEPFIAVNCGALPDTLLESELFGYKKGAFTGADRDKPGRFALAGKGTIFLDEIGEISQALQVRLLRVLQDKEFEPLGATKTETAKARVITATHRDLQKLVVEGKFRQDLFYRINIVSLKLPPLRERREDISYLADHFVKKFNTLQKREVKGIETNVYGLLQAYNWPGNVRELENVIERAFVLCGNSTISVKHLPSEFNISLNEVKKAEKETNIKAITAQNEKSLLIKALTKNNYSGEKTAKELGVHKTTLYRKIKKYNIELKKKK